MPSLLLVSPFLVSNIKKWVFDAGSAIKQAKWMARIKGVVLAAKGGEEDVVAEANEEEEQDVASSAAAAAANAAHFPEDALATTPKRNAAWVSYTKRVARKAKRDAGRVELADILLENAEGMAEWMALLERATGNGKGEGDVLIEPTKGTRPPGLHTIDPRNRGSKLGPKDEPLLPGSYLSHPEPFPGRATTLEVTELGDLLLHAGRVPDRTEDPLWAHRSTGGFGSHHTVGGFGCAVEAFLQRLNGEEDVQLNLSVKNGRWRVGRGMLCTMGRSPAPKGSWKRFLPWDARGRAIVEAELEMLPDGSVNISWGESVMWNAGM
eukprot:jgi/Undpi1/13498/HiC_scaffold_8.g03157.m1